MSRIADVLQKAQAQSNAPGGDDLRQVADVEIPWSLDVLLEPAVSDASPAGDHEREVLTKDAEYASHRELRPVPAPPRSGDSARSVSPVPAVVPSAREPGSEIRRPATASPVEPVAGGREPHAVSSGVQHAVENAGKRAYTSAKMDDEITTLVSRLFFSGDKGSGGLRHVLFTSVDEAGGSAGIASRVAEALAARIEQSVCLLDLDLRRPALHQDFNLEGRPGFSDALDDAAPIRAFAHQSSGSANLSVIPAGLRIGEAAGSIGDAEARGRLIELFGSFDYIIAHAAPIGLHQDTTLVGSCFDGVVLVADAGTTRSEAAHGAAESLKAGNARLLGTVLSSWSPASPR